MTGRESADSVETPDKGMSHVLGVTEWGGVRFHHSTQSGTQLKTQELLISVIFYLTYLDHGWPWITETTESTTMYMGRRDYCISKRTEAEAGTDARAPRFIAVIHNSQKADTAQVGVHGQMDE